MSLFILASGTLIADPLTRNGAKGPFTTVNLRVATGEGESILVSLIAFGQEGERLAESGKGAPISVSGRAKLSSWEGRDGKPAHGLSLVASEIIAARPRRAPAAEAPRLSAPRPAYPRHRLAEAPVDDRGRPLDDPLPF